MGYRLIVTVISDKEHPPITFAVEVPEALALIPLILMATPVKAVSLTVERAGGITLDKSKLLDFK